MKLGTYVSRFWEGFEKRYIARVAQEVRVLEKAAYERGYADGRLSLAMELERQKSKLGFERPWN